MIIPGICQPPECATDDPGEVATRQSILNDSRAGDEAGMMKCMFHTQDRYDICLGMLSPDRTALVTHLKSALGCVDGSFDDDSEVWAWGWS